MAKRLKQDPDLWLDERIEQCPICKAKLIKVNGRLTCPSESCPLIYLDFVYREGKVGVVLHTDARFNLEETLPSLESQKRGDVRNEEFQPACL